MTPQACMIAKHTETTACAFMESSSSACAEGPLCKRTIAIPTKTMARPPASEPLNAFSRRRQLIMSPTTIPCEDTRSDLQARKWPAATTDLDASVQRARLHLRRYGTGLLTSPPRYQPGLVHISK